MGWYEARTRADGSGTSRIFTDFTQTGAVTNESIVTGVANKRISILFFELSVKSPPIEGTFMFVSGGSNTQRSILYSLDRYIGIGDYDLIIPAGEDLKYTTTLFTSGTDIRVNYIFIDP